MSDLNTYRIIGVTADGSKDVDELIQALNKANARAKAEIRGIVVTSVEPEVAARAENGQKTSPDIPQTNEPKPREIVKHKKKRSQYLIMGWIVIAFQSLASFGAAISYFDNPSSPTLAASIWSGNLDVIAGSLGGCCGFSFLGILAAACGLHVMLGKRRVAGGILLVYSLVVILINILFTAV